MQRETPLNVMGVGNGAQKCEYDSTVPLALKRTDGTYTGGTYTCPTVEGSELSLLLGLDTLVQRRAVLDFNTMQLHFCGPNGVELDLSNGSESFQLELSPSGHLVLPCANYSGAKEFSKTPQGRFTLDDKPINLLSDNI